MNRKKSNTFDCLKCGGTFFSKTDKFICSVCDVPTLLRNGKDKPDYWLDQVCQRCEIECRECQIGKRWARIKLNLLKLDA